MISCRSWGALNYCAVLGPRAFGVQRPHLGLNLSLQTKISLGGRVALLAQSRSIAAAVLDWAEDIGLGFSAVVSVGDEAGVDVSAALDRSEEHTPEPQSLMRSSYAVSCLTTQSPRHSAGRHTARSA